VPADSAAEVRGKLVVVGQGYVGLPLSMRAVEVGWDVVGLDLDARRVDRLAAGDSYVEDVTSGELRSALDSGRFKPSVDYADCSDFDVVVITVPTPLQDGAPDLTYIEQSSAALASHIRRGATVILESTTYPGTTEELVAPLLEQGSGLKAGVDFHLGYSPERIDPGNRAWTFVTTPKVVSGIDPVSLAAVQGFYDTVVEKTVPVSTPREAELSKLLENTFRHVNIALVNEMAMYAKELGIDIWETIDAAATKPFGFMKFTPGPGVGGHCLPIDPSYLSWQVKQALGASFRFVELANDVNDHMPEYVVRRVAASLNAQRKPVNGSRLLLLGLAYKKNTGDARESPAPRIAEMLIQMGGDVRVVDPLVEASATVGGLGDRMVELTADEVAAADLVVVLTDHDSFDYAMVEESAAHVLDCRRVPELVSAERL